MPTPHGTSPHARGAASGSLQGRNPRDVRHRRCGSLYGDCGLAPGSTSIPTSDAHVVEQRKKVLVAVWDRGDRYGNADRERVGARRGHDAALPVDDQRGTSAFRRTSAPIVMRCRS
jgi:hypothetical protein